MHAFWRHMLTKGKRTALLLIALGFVLALVEFFVAGAISLLGIVLSAPQNMLEIPSLKMFFSLFPLAKNYVHEPMVILTCILGLACLCLLVKNLVAAFFAYKSTFNAYSISGYFTERLFASYIAKPFGWHMQQKPADLALYIQWRQHTATYVFYFFVMCMQLGIVFCLILGAFFLSPLGTVIVFCTTGCVGFLVYKFSRIKLDVATKSAKKADEQTNQLCLSCLQGIRKVYIYGKSALFKERMQVLLPAQTEGYAMRAFCIPLPTFILETTGVFTLLITLLLMQLRGDSATAIAGHLVLLAAVSWRILPAANKALVAILAMRGCLPMLEEMIPLMNVWDSSKENSKPIEAGQSLIFEKEICFNNVDFAYANAKSFALRDLNINIKKGQMVGLIGSSGAGKSTFVDVLTALVASSQGTLSVDGVPITPATQESWQKNIAYVAQTPYLTDASIAENIVNLPKLVQS